LSGVWPWLTLGAAVALLLALRWHDRRQLRRLIRWAAQPLGTPVPDAGGKWGDAFLTLHKRARQATEQRQQLHEALERFRQAAQAMPDGVVMLSGKRAIEWLNSQAEQLLGLDSRYDIGAPIVNLVREPVFVAALQGQPDSEPTLLHSTRQPGRVLLIHAVPFGRGQRIMLLVRDVSQSERLATMRRDFVANVSHELKTPLTVVAGFVETLADGWQDLSVAETQLLALAGEQAARMQRLIDDLLTLSTLETDAPSAEERIDVVALLAELREEAAALSAGCHQIVLIDEGPAVLLGNPRELRSAFGNLSANAVRYTPAGGRIELRWQWQDDGAAWVVSDSGIGIEAQHIPRLTERFYRVDRGRSRETGGTGLGLAIVKHVLERHGGHLRIDSSPGRGSRFAACLPARRVVAPPPTSSD
jgi:two-component system phosphate regulon sensor histidine kinase PhoR